MAVHSLARRGELALLGLFFLVVCWAPLPVASNRAWSTALLAALLWSLLALTLLLQAGQRVWALRAPGGTPGRTRITDLVDLNPPGSTRGRWLVSCLLGAFVIWAAQPLWGSALGLAWTAPVQSAHDTWVFVLKWLAALAGFALVLRLVNTPGRRRALLLTLLGAALVQALLALLLFSGGDANRIFGYDNLADQRANGTFANADHLAFYLVMGLSMGIGLMLGQMGAPAARRNLREQALQVLQFIMSPKMLLRMGLVVLVIALVLTRSRAGNGVFFISLLGLALWVMWRSPRLRVSATVLVVSLLVVDVIVVGQWVGLDKVVQRLQATDLTRQQAEQAHSEAEAAAARWAHLLRPERREESLEQRLQAVEASVPLVRQAPWQGHGAGTFYLSFAPRQTDRVIRGRFDHAHNDYAELLVDTGAVGLGLLAAAAVLTLRRVLRLMGDGPSPLDRGLLAGAGMALLCAAMHSAVDFNLQITANLLTLFLIMALVWTVPAPALATAAAAPR